MLRIQALLFLVSLVFSITACSSEKCDLEQLNRYSFVELDNFEHVLSNQFELSNHSALGIVPIPLNAKYEYISGPPIDIFRFYSEENEVEYMVQQNIGLLDKKYENLKIADIDLVVKILRLLKETDSSDCDIEQKEGYQLISALIPHQSKAEIEVFYIEKEDMMLVVRDKNYEYVDILRKSLDGSSTIIGAAVSHQPL